ncbi:hypothetical protein NBRC3279_1765 [Acetobacter pasteurianus NBRC 3279]|nr:hypothetical protein DB34_13490 [Acetobacter pasteurianus]GCD66274.1 hypothetical protein NBRC3279_1765 [Acetobacter pasteurianus NBRC 3279]GCD72583.1 hypothetical protein NBRC3284_1739 [Acetobacter pasteurianus NBRC 3284]
MVWRSSLRKAQISPSLMPKQVTIRVISRKVSSGTDVLCYEAESSKASSFVAQPLLSILKIPPGPRIACDQFPLV